MNEIITLFIALCSLLVSAIAVWFSIKNSVSQTELNDINKKLASFELSQIEKQNVDALKASFEINMTDKALFLHNVGLAPAFDVKLSFPNGQDFIIQSELDELFPYAKLDSGDSIRLITAVSMETQRMQNIVVNWDDEHDFGHEREFNIDVFNV